MKKLNPHYIITFFLSVPLVALAIYFPDFAFLNPLGLVWSFLRSVSNGCSGGVYPNGWWAWSINIVAIFGTNYHLSKLLKKRLGWGIFTLVLSYALMFAALAFLGFASMSCG